MSRNVIVDYPLEYEFLKFSSTRKRAGVHTAKILERLPLEFSSFDGNEAPISVRFFCHDQFPCSKSIRSLFLQLEHGQSFDVRRIGSQFYIPVLEDGGFMTTETIEAKLTGKDALSFDELMSNDIYRGFDRDRDDSVKKLHEKLDGHVFIDGIAHRPVSRPLFEMFVGRIHLDVKLILEDEIDENLIEGGHFYSLSDFDKMIDDSKKIDRIQMPVEFVDFIKRSFSIFDVSFLSFHEDKLAVLRGLIGRFNVVLDDVLSSNWDVVSEHLLLSIRNHRAVFKNPDDHRVDVLCSSVRDVLDGMNSSDAVVFSAHEILLQRLGKLTRDIIDEHDFEVGTSFNF